MATERKKIEIAARKRFLLDRISISRAPLGGWIITVQPWKIGHGSVPSGHGDPVTYRAVISGDTVTFTEG